MILLAALPTQNRVDRRKRGVVLVLVLFLTILLAASIAAFVRRATIDAMIIQNRDRAAQAEALARGGVRLAETLLLEDLVEDQNREETGVETKRDVWARAGTTQFEMEDGGVLRLEIRDAGSLINLNGFFKEEWPSTPAGELAVEFLRVFLQQVIDDMPGKPEEKLYDTETLVWNLIDYIDTNDTREKQGGPENELYEKYEPPYTAANRPLLSIDELRKIDGFDERLVTALEPYVTVYPYAMNGKTPRGINPNTAPEWVLRMLYYRDGISEYRLADEDIVRAISRARADGMRFCPSSGDECHLLSDAHEALDTKIYPTPNYESSVFIVRAEAKVGEVTKTIEAILDRAEPTELLLLSWRVL